MNIKKKLAVLGAALAISAPNMALAGPEDRRAMFGETHLHTNLSFDAFIFGNRNGPDAAYDFAKGKAITHPLGFDMKIRYTLSLHDALPI